MPETKTQRWSPRPIEDYSKALGGVACGPAHSPIYVNDVEAWNLAWLSHNYEKDPLGPREVNFNVMVKRTCDMVLATGHIDMIGKYPDDEKIRGLLRLDPEGFYFTIDQGIAQKTPLYQAYGDAWLRRMLSRALSHGIAEDDSDMDLSQAAGILAEIAAKPWPRN